MEVITPLPGGTRPSKEVVTPLPERPRASIEVVTPPAEARRPSTEVITPAEGASLYGETSCSYSLRSMAFLPDAALVGDDVLWVVVGVEG